MSLAADPGSAISQAQSWRKALGPAEMGIRVVRGLVHNGSLRSMARAVGVVCGAGALAAAYQIAHNEGQAFVHALRAGAQHRRARNDAVMLALIAAGLPIERLARLRRARDVFGVCIAMLTDPAIPDDQRELIRSSLARVISETQ
jgi:hypothetical protein